MNVKSLVAGLGFALLISAASSAASAPTAIGLKPLPVASAFNWTGAYVGANVGYSFGWTQLEPVGSLAVIAPFSGNVLRPNGGAIGLTLGYNYEFSNSVVLGIEADADLADLRASGAFTEDDSTGNLWNSRVDSFGTIRARAGYAFDRVLPYITGGVAWQHSTGAVNYESGGFVPFVASSVGWVVGAGVEYAFADHWTAKLEYLHMDFGNHNNPGITVSDSVTQGGNFSTTNDVVRLGLNYKF